MTKAAWVWLVSVAALSPFPSYAQDATAAFLPPAVEGFVAATTALAASAGPKIDSYRTEIRAIPVRKAIMQGILKSDGKSVVLGSFSAVSTLCDPRAEYSLQKAEKTYLDVITAKVDSTKKSDVSNVVGAFQALFKDYTIEPPVQPSGGANAEPDDYRRAARDNCVAETKTYFDAYYGSSEESISAIVTAVAGLYDVFKSIVAPAVIEGGKIIDEQRRARAIVEFLQNDQQRKAVSTAAKDMVSVLSEANKRDRARKFGAYLEQAALMKQASVAVGDINECKPLYALKDKGWDKILKQDDGLPHPALLACYRSVWSKYADSATSLLTAAAEYDQVADVNFSKEAGSYNQVITNLDKIRSGEGATFQQIWGAALRLVSLADKVQTAASDENRKKLSDAVKKVVESF